MVLVFYEYEYIFLKNAYFIKKKTKHFDPKP